MKELKYITTPIYYPNGDPHAGHAYTSVMADILKRWAVQQGGSVFLTTGVDEHGQKIQTAIRRSGLGPEEYLDRKSAEFRSLFDRLGVEYDFYVRTTAPKHVAAVQSALQRVYDAGLLELTEYEGLYCQECEMFKTASELDENGCCRDHGTAPLFLKEKNYSVPLEPYREWLRRQIEDNPDWIQPEECRNEMLQLLRDPLPPLCISRPKSRSWNGIELPFDTDYTAYVWFDALLNYVTSIGYPQVDETFLDRWTHSCHLIGKDIAKTHCIYWPVMLKALGLPLFGAIRVHPHWLGFDGTKMSKSKGNAVDPAVPLREIGGEAFRFYLAKNMGRNDSIMSIPLIRAGYEADLVNNIGNVFYRIVTLAKKYFGGALPEFPAPDPEDEEFLDRIAEPARQFLSGEPRLDRIRDRALAVAEIASGLNGWISRTKPWTMKQPAQETRRTALLLTLLEGVRLLFETAYPILPGTSSRALAVFGPLSGPPGQLRALRPGQALGEPFIAFGRKTWPQEENEVKS